MNEQRERKEKPIGAIIADRILTKEERAEVSKAIRAYDGSMPLDRYLKEKCPSLHLTYIQQKR